MTTKLWEIGLIILGSFFVGFAPILIKKGVNKIKSFKIKYFIKNYNLILGIFVYLLSYFITLPALRNGDLSILYPFMSLAYVWVCFFSIKFLNEKMNPIKWSGTIMIIIGVSIIGLMR